MHTELLIIACLGSRLPEGSVVYLAHSLMRTVMKVNFMYIHFDWCMTKAWVWQWYIHYWDVVFTEKYVFVLANWSPTVMVVISNMYWKICIPEIDVSNIFISIVQIWMSHLFICGIIYLLAIADVAQKDQYDPRWNSLSWFQKSYV